MNAFLLKYYKKGSIIAALFICTYSFGLLLIAIYAYRRPLYNWDMLGYIALVIQKTHKDVNEIHQKTYSSVKEVVPETNYTLQIAGNERRKTWAAYPNEFYSILPFYAIKPAYVEVVNLAYKMGFFIAHLNSFTIYNILYLNWISSILLAGEIFENFIRLFSEFIHYVFRATDIPRKIINAGFLVGSFITI